ncbi:MAG: PH domain-containing protein [Actinomycetota bacterium]
MTFSNEPLDLTGVPSLDPDAFRPLDPAHRRLLVLGHGVAGVIVAVATGIAGVTLGLIGGLIGLAGLVVIGVSGVISNAEATRMGWQVRERDISYRHGIVTRSVDTLPFVRIQHARVERGPFQRALGIATLHVNSAGPDVRISGLSAEDAERLRLLVIERSGAAEDDTPS